MDDKQFWPFPIPDSNNLSNEDLRLFSFMRTAFNEGFQSFHVRHILLGAVNSYGRQAEMLKRGGRGRYWEILLTENQVTVVSAFVDGFDAASDALLCWLHGMPYQSVMEAAKDSVVKKPGERGW